jgi:heptose I phosphotransferase
MGGFTDPVPVRRLGSLVVNAECLPWLHRFGLDSFDAVWRRRGDDVLKSIGERSVIRIRVGEGGGKTYYLKRHKRRFVGIRGLLPFLPGKALPGEGAKEFRTICDFRRAGLGTVLPVAAGERRHRFLWRLSFLLTEDFAPSISLEQLIRERPHFFSGADGEGRKRVLLREIARVARRMHQSGFNHLDFNATHILLRYGDDSAVPKIALFDLQRVDRRRYLRFRWAVKSLGRLNASLPPDLFGPGDLLFLFECYTSRPRLGPVEKLQWLWITRKTARIEKHDRRKRERRTRG